MVSDDVKFTRDGKIGRCKDGKTISVTVIPNSGYKFDGWSDGDTSNPRSVILHSHSVIAASVSLNVHTVRFWNGDTLLKTQSVTHGSSATAPDTPTQTGHTFTGWDKSFSNVTTDLDVYAQFTINTYTVRFFASKNATSPLWTTSVQYGSTDYAYAIPGIEGWTSVAWNKRSTTGNNYGQPVTDNVDYSPEYRLAFSGSAKTGSSGDANAVVEKITIPAATMNAPFMLGLLSASGQIHHEASPNHKATFYIYATTMIGMSTYRHIFLGTHILSNSNAIMNYSMTPTSFTHDWSTYDEADILDADGTDYIKTNFSNTISVIIAVYKQGGCNVAWEAVVNGEMRLI